MLNITLGTAGHIDHGKTALVKSLTGCETDRLKEEKERGMSIDLGYAPCCIADLEVGIVDVPGHEDFIKTMVAGACGMDGVILVVAADDGIMPQTREHLDILTLLGVRQGVVALTKIDRVDRERLDRVQSELAGLLQNTFLAVAPIAPLSNVSGEGFDVFLAALHKLVRAIPPKPTDGVFRLPLDRAFSAKGFGTVVAGIPIAGAAAIGDEVVLLPHDITSRVKRIEVYGQPSDTVLAGQCAAVNLGHCEAREIKRGDVLTLPGYFVPREFFLCRLRLLPKEKLLLRNGAQVKFHTGATEVNAACYLLEAGEMRGQGEGLVQLRTKRPVVAGPGDPFILRTFGPVQTIGGGTIVEATDRRVKRNRPGAVEELRQRAAAVGHDARFVDYALRTAEGMALAEADLARRTKVLRPRLKEILARLAGEHEVLSLGAGVYLHRAVADEAGKGLLSQLAQYHQGAPESPGMTLEQLRQACPWPKGVLEAVVGTLRESGRVTERNQRLALAEHRPTVRDQDARALGAVEGLFRQQLFHPPAAAELAEKLAVPAATVERLLGILQEQQRLVAVGEGLVFHQEAIDEARRRLVEHLRKEGRLESVDFKYLLDTTRKFALPLLDYFDRTGLLRRTGNTRFLKTGR